MKTYEVYAGNGATREIKDPARVQHDLQDILSEMGETIGAIEERFSPGEIVDHVFHGLRGFGRGSSDFATNLGRSVRDNPVPAALIGIGIGALMFSRARGGERERAFEREEGGGLGERMKGAVEGVKERAGERIEGMKERAEAMKERMAGGAGEPGYEPTERAGGLGERAYETGARVTARARGRAGQARHWLARTWEEQPLVLGAVCVAIGAALGSSLPISRREQETLGPASESTKERLAAAGQEAARSAEEVIAEQTERR